jgi:CelD/BcsL family acetyltransferase involved in cellulose biosynthesis
MKTPAGVEGKTAAEVERGARGCREATTATATAARRPPSTPRALERARAGAYETQLIVDVAEAEALAPEWDALAVAASKPFAAPAWVLAWWRHVAPAGISPRVVAVRDGGRLVAVAPFHALPRRRGVVEYRLMSSDFGASMEPLALPGREWEMAAELAHALAAASPRPDVLAFGPMPIASSWPAALSAGWEGPIGALVRRLRISSAHTIVLDDASYEEWFASLSPKLRRDLRRCERLFEETGGSTRWATAETLRADAESFSRLHRERWEGRGWSRLAEMGAGLADWLEDLGRPLIAQGRFGMCLLEIDGTPICADFQISAGDELVPMNAGWDERYANLSPAKVAVLRVLRGAFEQGARRVSLGSGDSSNKLRLANGYEPVAWTLVLPPSAGLPAAYARALPDLLRAHARDVAVRALTPERLAQTRRMLKHLRG